MVRGMPSMPSSRLRFAVQHRTLLLWTLGILAAVVAWDAGGQDIPLARAFGSASGFPMREQWFFVQVLHEGARRLGWLLPAKSVSPAEFRRLKARVRLA